MRALGGKGTRTMNRLIWVLLLVTWSLSGTYSQEGCDQNLIYTIRGSIQYPDSTNSSLMELNCTYSFSQWDGNSYNWYSDYNYYMYKLTFTEFNLHTNPDGSCGGDYVEVYEVNRNNSQYFQTIHHLCGNIMPPVFQRVFKVRFVSSQSTAPGYGFRANFTRTIMCGEDYSGESGYLYTYIPYAYQAEYNCTWTVKVDVGRKVWLIVNYFYQYSYTDDCQAQYTKIYDGLNRIESKLLLVLCKSSYYDHIQIESSSDSILIEFYSNGSNQYTHGSGYYIAVNDRQDCGPEHLINNTGTFGLPAYYQGYWKNGVCTWNISASEGSVIQVAFAQLYHYGISYYTYSNQCNATILKVYDGFQTTEKNLLSSIWCGSGSQLITSITNNLIIQLIINDTHGYAMASITASYETVVAADVRRNCGGQFTGAEGTFSSPNYPSNYTPLSQCIWNISVDPAFVIQLDIYNMNIESSVNCMYDSLQQRYQPAGFPVFLAHDPRRYVD